MSLKFSILLSISLAAFACKSNENQMTAIRPDADSVNATIPTNVDDDFNVFINYFSKDSIFQISRINFPLKVQEYDSMKDTDVIKTVTISNFRKLDFTYKKPGTGIDNQQQEIKVEKNKATIEINGIENGLMIDFYFEKQNGKWSLVTWIDHST
jgi:hypothetical protein